MHAIPILGNPLDNYAQYYLITKPCEVTSWSGSEPWAYSCFEYDIVRAYVIDEPEESKGKFIDIQCSTERSKYPNNNKQGEYWYVWKGIE